MKYFGATFITALLAVIAAGQTTVPHPDTTFPTISPDQRETREREMKGPEPRRPRGQVLRIDPALLKTMTAEQLKAFAANSAIDSQFIPPAEYISKYHSYAMSDIRGIARIFPDKNCGRGSTVTLAELERCADVPTKTAGGSLYNFRAPGVRNLRKLGWVLHFENGKFEVGNDLVQSVVADIGDVDLETIDLDHSSFKFLSGYDAKQKRKSILQQKEVLAKGIVKDGYNFTNSVPVKNGSTYALRTLIYRYAEAGGQVPRRGFDQYIVFKVVGVETDGSAIIIWKELKRDFPRRQIEM